jgi:hypothetical protein
MIAAIEKSRVWQPEAHEKLRVFRKAISLLSFLVPEKTKTKTKPKKRKKIGA